VGIAAAGPPQKKMKRILLTLAIAISLCGCKSSPGPLAKKLLAVSSEAGVPPTDKLNEIFELAEERTKGKTGSDRIDSLNRLVFEELKFEREVKDDSIKFMLLPHVLEHKKGSCLGLAALYLVLAERLEIKIHGVLAPRHFFLRHQERNIELLRKGEAMPDDWYRKTWQVPEGASAYMRPLTEEELLAVFRFNLANARRMKGEYQKAEEIYRQVLAAFPDFAEAHANLGLVLQLQKKFKSAEAAYLKAQFLQPGLPGLKQNMDALRTDMGL
jgi:regulator of sirC expression with transglutaminase-like and TPR domain